MKTVYFSLILLLLTFSFGLAQAQRTGLIQGTVRDKNTQQLLPGVAVYVEQAQTGTNTDDVGRYKINLPVGSYNLRASLLGYRAATRFNVNLTSGNDLTIDFELEQDAQALGEVEVTGDRRRTTDIASLVTPLSVQSLSAEEIRSNPGGNFDISRVIQVLPGVAGTSGSGGFRNDIIIRGGGPNENVYYLDGIEIPVINHFSTQGSAGGPVGILNVSFIEDVKLTSSAFDARYDNALSSTLEFRQKEGNRERLQGNVRLSSTELAATFEGPIGKKNTFLASARRSYLQYLFQALDLPIRPNYWDFQFKNTYHVNAKTTVNLIGIGAIDEFSFGVPKKSSPEREYILRSIPSINQWNYTVGVGVRHLIENGYWNLALSRTHFNNELIKFEDGKKDGILTFDSRSDEIENKLRLDWNKTLNGWKLSAGLVGQVVQYRNDFYNRLFKEIRDSAGNLVQPEVAIRFNTAPSFLRYGAFAQVSRTYLKGKLGTSFGLRTDLNTFTDEGNNPLKTLSPRGALSYQILDWLYANASLGRYYKMPIYTVLGYKDSLGRYVNRDNRYIGVTHWVAGLEFKPRQGLRLTVEGFLKQYDHYPISVRDGISLANQGGGFGAIGNERTQSTGKGRAWGFEVYGQQQFTGKVYAVLSYTFVRSEFSGLDGRLKPSSWDNRHLISALLGIKFKRNWELGLKERFAGGAPYTPFDEALSLRNYPSLGVGTLDYSRLNSVRLKPFNQLDIRIDKKFNFKRVTLDLYLDLQNALLSPNPSYPSFTLKRTDDGKSYVTTDGQPLRADASNGIPVILNSNDATVTPSLGFILEF